MYKKRFHQRENNIGNVIDKFETLFAKLDRMVPNTKAPESHKAPLLLGSMGTTSQLESTVEALTTKNKDELSWKNLDQNWLKGGIL